MMKEILKNILKGVDDIGAEKYNPARKDMGKTVVITKKVIDSQKADDDLDELLKSAQTQPEGEEGKDWEHSEGEEDPAAEKLEKEAGIHKKPDWEKFEDDEPDWIKDPEIVSKVAKARRKGLKA